MSIFKSLKNNDIITTPHKVYKEWVITNNPFPDNDNVKVYRGVKTVRPNISSTYSNNHYDSLNYEMINSVFYQEYDDITIDSSSLMNSNYYENVVTGSLTKPDNRYNNKYTGFVNNFPTIEGSTIYIFQINTKLFGDRILPGSFKISSDVYDMFDDKYGNICDAFNSNEHIGNVFYEYGIIVLTNQYYISLLPEIPVAVDDYIVI